METLTTMEQQLEEARMAAREAPEDLEALLLCAQMCLKRDLRLEALQHFQTVLESQPRVEARFGLAQLFARQQHFLEAYDELRRLFELEPLHVLGHALLLALNSCESVPEDLQPRLNFVPSRKDLAEQRLLLEAEREVLAGEVDQYRNLASAPDAEPILQYHFEESRKRVERVQTLLERLEAWEKLALEVEPAKVEPAKVEPAKVEAAEIVHSPETAKVPPSEKPLSVADSSEALQGFYAGINLQVDEVLGQLGRTRGVLGSLLLAEDFGLVWKVGLAKEPATLLQDVLEGVGVLRAYRPDFKSWVLESGGGLFVVQQVDARHLLIVLAKAKTNLGTLRYTIEKNRSDLAELVASRPAL
jgi:hypothetical protein